ncbi:hypothetical protein [Sphingobium yanoikuyae]|uniref:hypothetical protein n=1 Tax=Sphingobium yanoikuyae TaxID=13690 RepID=UPI0035B183CD
MTIQHIKAHFECDGCAKQFTVGMDCADSTRPALPALADLAEDVLRGGNPISGECGSVQDGLHLCRSCTRLADNIGDDDHVPTRDEILRATGAIG